jgi:YgiT-type zinc finger domain-containing protein
MEIKTCPSCGSRRIEKLCRDWRGDFQGKRYVVRDLEYYECPACGERVFDREAMRKIEARSPAFAQVRMKRTA